MDLTLTLDYHKSKFPVELTTCSQVIDPILQKCGFHVVPAGFDSWRISFSMAEKEILAFSPDGFKACCRVLKVLRDEISKKLGWDSSLIPSYMLKTVVLSELFMTDGYRWDKDSRAQSRLVSKRLLICIETTFHLYGNDFSFVSKRLFICIETTFHLYRNDFDLYRNDLYRNNFVSKRPDTAQRTIQVLELALRGVEMEKIPNFFMPGQNLLAVADHENRLRQCVLEDMLNQMKG